MIIGIAGQAASASISVRGSVPIPASYWLSHTDPITCALRDTLYFIGDYPIEDVIADVSSGDSMRQQERVVFHEPVVERPYRWYEDSANYSSVLTGLRLFLATLGLATSDHFDPSGEHQCTHRQITGRATTYAKSSWLLPVEYQGYPLRFWGSVVVRKNAIRNDTPISLVRKVAAVPNQYAMVGTNYYGVIPVATSSMLAYLGSKAEDTTWESLLNDHYQWDQTHWGFYHYTVVDNLNFVFHEDRSCELTYRIRNHLSNSTLDIYTNPKYRFTFDNKVSWTVNVAEVGERTALMPNQTRYMLRPSHLTLTTSFLSTCIQADGWGAPFVPISRYLDYSPYNNWNVPEVFSTSSAVATYDDLWFTSYPITGDRDYQNREIDRMVRHDILGSFSSKIDGDLPSIRCSAFISSSEALELASSDVDSNLIEALSELPEFLNVLPDVKGLLSILKSFLSRGGIFSVGALVRWLASEDLRLVFGTMPNLELLIEVLPRLVSTIVRLRKVEHRPITGRGSYTYSFPSGTFGRSTCRLSVHTKAVCNSYPNGELASILDMKTLGLLPSTSNLWDLIPFSFVLDWGLNIHDRFRTLENMALLSAMPMRCLVHSYLITSPLSGDADAYGVHEESDVPPSYRLYRREISGHIPTPSSGKFDFLLPSRLPNLLTAGSLVVTR